MAQLQVTRAAGRVQRQPLLQMGARVGAAQNSAAQATGLDGRCARCVSSRGGSWLLTAVVLGIAACGVYSFEA